MLRIDISKGKPTLRKTNQGWYIECWTISPGKKPSKRIRKTFNLNTVKDLDQRQLKSQCYIKDLLLGNEIGHNYDLIKKEQQKQMLLASTNIIDAINLSLQLKDFDRKTSMKSYKYAIGNLKKWIVLNRLEDINISDFSMLHCRLFFDHLRLKKNLAGMTLNNHKGWLSSLFNELKKREYIKENHFVKINKHKMKGKRRRPFSQDEKKLVAHYIYEHDKMLFLSVLLLYHCFIRPRSELRRLRIGDFDLNNQLIRLVSDQTKNRFNEIITIPDIIMPYLREMDVWDAPDEWLLFGKGVRPHPDKACAETILGQRQNNLLDQLIKMGKLKNRKGLHHYSWKDTGAIELFRQNVPVNEIMKQLRHKSLDTTQKYLEDLNATHNVTIKSLQNSIFQGKQKTKLTSL